MHRSPVGFEPAAACQESPDVNVLYTISERGVVASDLHALVDAI
jgi:hypothetical protein